MSYEAAQAVVEAARRYRPGTEDFLTELLAAALQAHAGFASALCREVGLPAGERRRARTHVTEKLPEGRWGFIDMELEIRDARGHSSLVSGQNTRRHAMASATDSSMTTTGPCGGSAPHTGD